MLNCPLCQYQPTTLFHKLKKYQYLLCSHCQTLFLHPQPDPTKLTNYYQTRFQFDAGRQNEKRTRQQARKILNNLIKLNPKRKALLDIGSGYGYFLDEASKKGYKTLGIEPATNLPKVNSIKSLIEIKRTDFDTFYKKNKKKKFDFITLNHVVEHLNNPQETIKKAAELLTKNGILYIETPNLNSHLFKAEQKNYTFLTPPEHLWLFSLKSIKKMIKQTRTLEIITSSSYSYPEHLMGIVKAKLKIKNPSFAKASEGKQKLNYPVSSFQFLVSSYLIKTKENINYLLFDRMIAPIFTNILNLGGYGSILELYIKKK